MGAPVHQFEVGHLPDGEGLVTLLEEGWEKPPEDEVMSRQVVVGGNFTRLFHDPCGRSLDSVTLSKTKRVLVCKHCLLRVAVPLSVTTVAEFRSYISRA